MQVNNTHFRGRKEGSVYSPGSCRTGVGDKTHCTWRKKSTSSEALAKSVCKGAKSFPWSKKSHPSKGARSTPKITKNNSS